MEIDSEEEYAALEKEWENVNSQNECQNNGISWWIGITDAKEESVWVTDYSSTGLGFSAWSEGEPNNRGQEDCAVANLGFLIGKDSFNWFDVPCGIRGFSTKQGQGISFNPLCEQYPLENLNVTRCEGCDEKWIEVGEDNYKFIKASDGTTRDEAEQICQDNGGHLADIKSEEERKALKEYYEKNLKPTSSFFLNLIKRKNVNVKYGWWIGATDEVEEGLWMWKQTEENVTYSAWFKGKDIPDNENLFTLRRS